MGILSAFGTRYIPKLETYRSINLTFGIVKIQYQNKFDLYISAGIFA